MLCPTVPEWVEAEITRRWNGVKVSWERFPERWYVVKPIDGPIFARAIEGGKVKHRYLLEGHVDDYDWFEPQPHECLPWRFTVRDTYHRRHEERGVRIFDCLSADGDHIPPGQRWVSALAERYGQVDRALKEMEADENFLTLPDGTVLNRQQAAARQAFEDEMKAPALWTLEKLDGIPLVGHGNAPLHGRTGVATKAERRVQPAVSSATYQRLAKKAQIVRGG